MKRQAGIKRLKKKQKKFRTGTFYLSFTQFGVYLLYRKKFEFSIRGQFSSRAIPI